jgi:hypothetical protein
VAVPEVVVAEDAFAAADFHVRVHGDAVAGELPGEFFETAFAELEEVGARGSVAHLY